MSEKFIVTWEADDGHVGASAPHRFKISEDDFDDDYDEATLSSLFWDAVQEDFQAKVSPVSRDEAEFIVWAKEKMAERKAADK